MIIAFRALLELNIKCETADGSIEYSLLFFRFHLTSFIDESSLFQTVNFSLAYTLLVNIDFSNKPKRIPFEREQRSHSFYLIIITMLHQYWHKSMSCCRSLFLFGSIRVPFGMEFGIRGGARERANSEINSNLHDTNRFRSRHTEWDHYFHNEIEYCFKLIKSSHFMFTSYLYRKL